MAWHLGRMYDCDRCDKWAFTTESEIPDDWAVIRISETVRGERTKSTFITCCPDCKKKFEKIIEDLGVYIT